MATPSPPATRFSPLVRGLAGACPHCGSRGVFKGIADLKDACPTCRFSFVREEGYWLGAMIVIFAIILVLFGTWTVGGMVLLWPDPPWNRLMIGGILINGIVPFVLYGWSKTIWVGLDMSFNPARLEEFAPDEPVFDPQAPDGPESS